MLQALAVVVVVIGAVLGFAATRPDTFRTSRAKRIEARPEKIAPLIQDFRRWTAWSPWEKLDPALKRTYSGTPQGKGAMYEWEGNKKVGQGRMEITEASPTKTVIKLDFLKPMEAHSTAEFVLEPAGDSTNVTWTMYGSNTYAAKLMTVFMNMDRMLGKSFEEGLDAMKRTAEA
jgi:hypothetical protein